MNAVVGLPNMKIVPDGWQQHHQPTIRATMRSTVRITRLADQAGTRDPVAGRTAFATPWVVYEGVARVQARTTGAQRGKIETVADQALTIGAYLVAIPPDVVPIKVGDLVKVMTCGDSPALVGLQLAVADVPHADTALQRNVGCNLHQPTTRG